MLPKNGEQELFPQEWASEIKNVEHALFPRMGSRNYAPPKMGRTNYSPGIGSRNKEWEAWIIPQEWDFRKYVPPEWGAGIIPSMMGSEVMLSKNRKQEFYPQEWGFRNYAPSKLWSRNHAPQELGVGIRIPGMGAAEPCSQEWEVGIRLPGIGNKSRGWQKSWI